MHAVLGFIVIMFCVAALMLLGELLHKIFRVARPSQRLEDHSLSELWMQSGEQRYSVRHLERFFLIAYVWILSFFFLLTRSATFEPYLSFNSLSLWIVIIAAIGVWWAFRRGVLR